MPGPTPITAAFQMDFHYSCAGLAHIMQLRVNHAVLSGGVWKLNQYSGVPVDASDAADHLWTAMAPFMSAVDATFDQYVLQEYVSGVYIPREAGATAVVPTAVPASIQASQMTFVFRDSAYDLLKVIVQEGVTPVLGHYPYAALGSVYSNFVDNCLNTADGQIGAWLCGRNGAAFPASFTAMTMSYNRKTRRRRGMV